MTVDDLKLYYRVKTDTELALKVKCTKAAISKWRNKGISLKTQAVLQLLTNGEVKANPQVLSA